MKNGLWIIGSLATLGACDMLEPVKQDANLPVARLPKQVCTQAQVAIEKLSESGGFVYDGDGKGTIEQAAWLQLQPNAREQLLQVLAYDAACKAKEPPAEQIATIRNESGQIVSERVIETSADLSRVLED